MPEVRFKKPCNDCPYRRAALPGWLGSGDADHFIKLALADYADYDAPCHLTIDYEDKNWLETQYEDSSLCAGALIFFKNVDEWRMPRDPARSRNLSGFEPDHETVFSSEEEFRRHHETEEGRQEWLSSQTRSTSSST